MGTRSTIALEFADGSVAQVYCHWDGYLSHNGKILLNSYMDPFKVRELIDLGDLSSLAAEIGIKHPFDNPHRFDTPEWLVYREQFGNMCKFYGRDRGENSTRARYFTDFADYKENGQFEEYDYILRQVNGEAVWYVSDHGSEYRPLMEAYIEEMRQAHEGEFTE
jgi:hypothetical protein